MDPRSLLDGNGAYVAARHGAVALPPVPAKGLVILTCMDVRIDPLECFALAPGSAHVLRNAGARVTEDVIRSVAVSTKLMGTDHVVILGHTNCGLSLVSNFDMGELMSAGYGRARFCDGRPVVERKYDGPGCARGYDYLAFSDIDAAIREDSQRLAVHPFVPPQVRISAFVLDVDTGRVREVAGAARAPGPLAEGDRGEADMIESLGRA